MTGRPYWARLVLGLRRPGADATAACGSGAAVFVRSPGEKGGISPVVDSTYPLAEARPPSAIRRRAAPEARSSSP
ncbi:hypothetical protein [Streptomyces sp. NPDC045470]|uniref:hypothetical protein n=1 Tax=unclassified Streptomyces TaxID=2593676 RepID=UPI0033E19897